MYCAFEFSCRLTKDLVPDPEAIQGIVIHILF